MGLKIINNDKKGLGETMSSLISRLSCSFYKKNYTYIYYKILPQHGFRSAGDHGLNQRDS